MYYLVSETRVQQDLDSSINETLLHVHCIELVSVIMYHTIFKSATDSQKMAPLLLMLGKIFGYLPISIIV